MSEWSKIPLYVASFLRKAQLSSQLQKYVKESSIEIPFEEFYGFASKDVWGVQGLSLYESRDELNLALELMEKMGNIRMEGQTIKISQTQYKALIAMTSTSLSFLRDKNIPPYSKELVRRPYLASQPADSKLLAMHKQERFEELDAAIMEDFRQLTNPFIENKKV